MRLPFRKRLEELDARVEDAQQRAREATREAEISAQRRKDVEKNVVAPLHNAGTHNQFAELIRRSLLTGHENHS